MTRSDRYYLEARAEEELERAREAADPNAISSHRYVAALYLEKLHGERRSATVLPALQPSST